MTVEGNTVFRLTSCRTVVDVHVEIVRLGGRPIAFQDLFRDLDGYLQDIRAYQLVRHVLVGREDLVVYGQRPVERSLERNVVVRTILVGLGVIQVRVAVSGPVTLPWVVNCHTRFVEAEDGRDAVTKYSEVRLEEGVTVTP
jgi:hypothetical protein